MCNTRHGRINKLINKLINNFNSKEVKGNLHYSLQVLMGIGSNIKKSYAVAIGLPHPSRDLMYGIKGGYVTPKQLL